MRWDAVRISVWALIFGWLFRTIVKLLVVILRSPTAICLISLIAITGSSIVDSDWLRR